METKKEDVKQLPDDVDHYDSDESFDDDDSDFDDVTNTSEGNNAEYVEVLEAFNGLYYFVQKDNKNLIDSENGSINSR